MTLRPLVLAAAIAFIAFVPLTQAAVTDCSIQKVGVPCVTSSGGTGTCQPTYDYASMTCQATASQNNSQTGPTVPADGTYSNTGPTVPSPAGQTGIPQSNGTNVTLTNPLNTGGADCSANGTCLEAFLGAILQFVVRIGSIAVILMLVYAGFKFVTARGEPGKIIEARTMLLWTVIGALVLLGAQAIALGIQATVQAISVGQ